MSRFLKKTFLFSIGTFLSRILGFVREIIFSSFFGASFFSDIFFACFRIPNLLRKLLAEGTLSFAFINVYSDIEKQDGERRALHLSSVFFNWILVITTFLYFLVIIYSNNIIYFLLPGFEGEKAQIASIVLKWVFPFIIFISTGAVFSGFLNIKNSFFVPAVSSSFLNIFLIAGVLFFYDSDYIKMGKNLGICVNLAGISQFVLLWFYAVKNGFFLKFSLKDRYLKNIFLFFIPGTFAMAISQINILVDSMFSSMLPNGGYSYLWYGNRLVQFPLALFGIAISTVMTPYFARKNNLKDISDGIRKAMRINSILLIPCTIGFVILSTEIIKIVFYRGNFDLNDLTNVASVLLYYSLGLWFFSALKIILPLFYSLKKVYIPVIAAFISLISNTILNFILIKKMGASGLALATSISAFINLIFLMFFLKKYIDTKFTMFIPKLISISLIFTFLVFLLKDFHILINISMAALFYIFLLLLFKVEEFDDLKRIVAK